MMRSGFSKLRTNYLDRWIIILVNSMGENLYSLLVIISSLGPSLISLFKEKLGSLLSRIIMMYK